MINKYIALALLTSTSTLCYFPSANAANYNGYTSNGINVQAWHEFKRAKQMKYDRDHQLERAPFPTQIAGGNMIKVNLSIPAWAAYDSEGRLIKWGSASGGKDFCPDIGKSCESLTGTYTFYRKQGSSCKSNLFPVGRGGAPMPYCMHFNGGFALHGSPAVPDFNASHGCIRVPVREAQWLNQNFVKVGKTRISISYN